MTGNRSTWFTFGCWSVLLVCIIAGFALLRYQKMNSCLDHRGPLQGFVVNIDPSQSHLLIEQMRKFSDRNKFKFDLAYFTPDLEDFRVDLLRDDVEVILRSLFNRGEFEVGFYNYDCIHPTTTSDIDQLVAELKISMGEISSVTITEEN